jgi:alkaline phosphatase
MLRLLVVFSLIAADGFAAGARARNVILFLGDAGGIPTLHAASLYKHNHPQKLFLQSLPYIALSDTSAADAWVTDSAAGMSAIVTGHKTNNGVISQSAAAVRGKRDGVALQTILEHAEQRGLSTGVLTNMPITDATPAACYAHSNDRSRAEEIFIQVLRPRFGDGVDVLIGAGRDRVTDATSKLGVNIEAALREKGFAVRDSLASISNEDRRVVALFNSGDFDVSDAVRRTIRILERNKKGYFLMVEWDMHTNNVRKGLEHVAEMDNAIREAAGMVGSDTLILFTADHSFDLRVRGGKPGEPANTLPGIRVDNAHTGEQVLVAARGPGAERVHGFLTNTDLFYIMMAAYGWAPQ